MAQTKRVIPDFMTMAKIGALTVAMFILMLIATYVTVYASNPAWNNHIPESVTTLAKPTS